MNACSVCVCTQGVRTADGVSFCVLQVINKLRSITGRAGKYYLLSYSLA